MDILPDGSSSGTNVRLVDGVSKVVASWALHMHDTSGKGQHLQCHLGSKTCLSGECSETGMALLHLFAVFWGTACLDLLKGFKCHSTIVTLGVS